MRWGIKNGKVIRKRETMAEGVTKNFDGAIRSLTGKALMTADEDGGAMEHRCPHCRNQFVEGPTREATYADVIVQALSIEHEGEKMDYRQKAERGRLIEKVLTGGDNDYSVEELTKIKECCGKGLSIHACAQVCKLIDAKTERRSEPQEPGMASCCAAET